ncbi:NAD(P) transhydrogenase subunit alpha [Porphyromonas uenonis]|uniref:NAD(P) transhydrogenase subunit alpha n=1 Tax=Porphyromonas uenonis TaxID=281920 RepID=UPI00046ED63B|nr:NAD(P) transhydrogenase subunit alpha [Porphyromonas uenonis]
MNPLILVAIFLVATFVGYKLISNVPSLLHTPLMSGMNALSGVTITGALAATATAIIAEDGSLFQQIFGVVAVILATINVVGGFGVTNRMLRMFTKNKKGGKA